MSIKNIIQDLYKSIESNWQPSAKKYNNW